MRRDPWNDGDRHVFLSNRIGSFPDTVFHPLVALSLSQKWQQSSRNLFRVNHSFPFSFLVLQPQEEEWVRFIVDDLIPFAIHLESKKVLGSFIQVLSSSLCPGSLVRGPHWLGWEWFSSFLLESTLESKQTGDLLFLGWQQEWTWSFPSSIPSSVTFSFRSKTCDKRILLVLDSFIQSRDEGKPKDVGDCLLRFSFIRS